MTGRVIYHITTAAQWDAARARGSYRAPSLDDEGFIHFSDAGQLDRVAAARFAGMEGLVVLEVPVSSLPADVRLVDEPGEPGSTERFPHLYGELPTAAVARCRPLPPPPPVP